MSFSMEYEWVHLALASFRYLICSHSYAVFWITSCLNTSSSSSCPPLPSCIRLLHPAPPAPNLQFLPAFASSPPADGGWTNASTGRSCFLDDWSQHIPPGYPICHRWAPYSLFQEPWLLGCSCVAFSIGIKYHSCVRFVWNCLMNLQVICGRVKEVYNEII